MDKTLSTICAMLQKNDNLHKCGAALVLAELAPKQKDVVNALGEAIEGSNEQQLACILEALNAIGSADAIPYVMPLLSSEDIPTKMRAISIMAHGGSSVIPLIKEQMEAAPRQYKVVFIDLLARIHSKESMSILLNMISVSDFQLVKETCEAVRRHIGEATPAKLQRLHTQVASFLDSAKAKNSERITASCLLIIGNIGIPPAASLILKYIAPKQSPYLRRNALTALKSVRFGKSSVTSLWKQLAPLLDDDDPETVRHALEVIEKIPDTAASRTQWKKLLKSKAPAVRTEAARKLSEGDSIDTARSLIGLLKADESDVRDIAARALAHHKKAPSLLLSELCIAKSEEYAWLIAKILKPHAESTDRKTVKKLSTMAAKDMLEDNPRHEALLYFLRHADPSLFDKVMLDAGQEFRKAKKWRPAVSCLRKLIHTELFNNDLAYELSISNLKLSHKDISPIVRDKDYSLRGLQSLLNKGSGELLSKLTKDRSLDSSDIFYVGFHFSEGPGFERDFGEELLKHLIKKWPKTDQAKAARKKLGISRSKPSSTRKKSTSKKVRKKPAKKKQAGKKK